VDLVAHYVIYIKTACDGRYRHWWDDDAVPIYWTVMGDDDGFGCEQAPFDHDGGDNNNVLTYYRDIKNVATGEPINWYRDLPVINSRFPKFAAALSWLPSPGQPTAPLRSIVDGISQAQRGRSKRTA
jgi:hypothetical protein